MGTHGRKWETNATCKTAPVRFDSRHLHSVGRKYQNKRKSQAATYPFHTQHLQSKSRSLGHLVAGYGLLHHIQT